MAPESQKLPSKKPSQAASRAWDALTPATSEWILEAVSSMGFDRMTPVQASCIPLFAKNSDVVVEAVTGSGKTLAFLIPIVERLLRLEEPIRKHHVGAIIISPTRELATQIHSVLLSLLAFHAPSSAHLNPPEGSPENPDEPDTPIAPASMFSSSTLKVVPQLLLGGKTTTSQDLAHFLTHSPNLLISTPGRLLELLSSPYVHCPQSSFEVLVLDEADRLLDLGFKEDLQKILQRLPKQRRTGLFSASISEAVDQLVRVGLRNPVRIAVKVKGLSGAVDQRTPASLQMTYLTTPPTHKLPALIALLHNLQPIPIKSIAYVSTCAAVDYFSRLLPCLLPSKSSLLIVPLHGQHPPNVRMKNFHKYTSSSTPTLLLTTDVAARGLDIPAVDLTIQLDPPSDPKTFLHRAGRAGRAGRKGLAIVFLLPGRESDEYPSFLSVRKTPVENLVTALSPHACTPTTHKTGIFTLPPSTLPISSLTATASTAALRKTILTDRALHDTGQRAFVSWVRAYSKHAASSIFRVGDIEWEEQANGWGLLKLPKMPEIRAHNKKIAHEKGDEAEAVKSEGGDIAMEDEMSEHQPKDHVQDTVDPTLALQINWLNYRYLNAARETKRLAALAAPAPERPKARLDLKKKAWSSKNDAKAEAVARRERKSMKREMVRRMGLTEEERKKEEEVDRLVEVVRRRNEERGREMEEEFSGFD